MAELFIKQAKQYAETRPNYPEELFKFITSKTTNHDLAWDVGTGSGQAAASLSGIFENVIGTETSPKQIEFATKLPNIRYELTSPAMSIAELEQNVAAQSTVDLVTIAQAMHWFDLPQFYNQVKWVLKKPNGVIATWCYTVPEVNVSVDAVFQPFYTVDSDPFWEPQRKLVDNKYMTIDFPFEPVDGADSTGPFDRFVIEKTMDLEGYFSYIRSWSAYQTAKDKGVELLTENVIENFRRAWNEDGQSRKVVRFPIYLRIGKVGNNI
ncbi:methyltransferase 11 domain-containing protein [Citrus sinensis]|uniref:Methyltransferase 11 domain-containing protein n=1 Tax=Citrus sinensis TaxID=2711 RepID=A0ACB8HYL9_CITSI|nr:methyltransferase 11 domain-containing protein [Citrus sinensis]